MQMSPKSNDMCLSVRKAEGGLRQKKRRQSLSGEGNVIMEVKEGPQSEDEAKNNSPPVPPEGL